MTRTLVVPVRGMTCGACAATIERGLQKLPGVESASVSLATRTATVHGPVAEPDVLKRIAALGYEGLPAERAAEEEQSPARPALRRSLTAALLAAGALLILFMRRPGVALFDQTQGGA